MAHTAHHPTSGNSILHLLAAPFVALGNALVAMGEANTRQAQIIYLESLSDAELAERGITRDGIVMYVYRDCAGF